MMRPLRQAQQLAAAVAFAAFASVALAVPPTRDELAQWCAEAEDMGHCGRLVEERQMKRLPGLAKREGVRPRVAL